MKKYKLDIAIVFLALIASTLFSFAKDQPPIYSAVGTLTVKQDGTVEGKVYATPPVEWQSDVAPVGRKTLITRLDVTDVVWALETLMKYAPKLSTEPDYSLITTGSSGLCNLTTAYPPPAPNPAKDLRDKADAIEQQDRDIKRAREILERWRKINTAIRNHDFDR